MKRLLATLGVLLILPLAFAFGCKKDDEKEEWVEVQHVTWYDKYSGHLVGVSSRLTWVITEEPITPAEYDSAPEELKDNFTLIREEVISTDRKSFLAYADKKIGDVYYRRTNYISSPDVHFYDKYTYTSYELGYIKVRFLGNDSIEIKFIENSVEIEYYGKQIITISPSNGYINNSDLPYEITYFEN